MEGLPHYIPESVHIVVFVVNLSLEENYYDTVFFHVFSLDFFDGGIEALQFGHIPTITRDIVHQGVDHA